MDQVGRDPEAPISPDRPGSGGLGVGGARDQPHHGDRRAALQGEGHDRTGRDVLDQGGVERLAFVLRVVALRGLRRDPKRLRGDDFETLRFEARDDRSDEATTYPIRFHEHERPLFLAFRHRTEASRTGA